MSKLEKIIKEIQEAESVELDGFDFDFDECFKLMREMEYAMSNFVDRVEKGEVRSTRTYNQFKKILDI